MPATATTPPPPPQDLLADDSSILEDDLDETSILFTPDPVQVLIGNEISTNMGTIAPYTISTAQMTISDPTNGFTRAGWGWESPTDIPTWYQNLVYDAVQDSTQGAGAYIMLCSTNSTTIYIDPDQGDIRMSANVPIYSHMSTLPGGVVEPQFNEGGITGDTGYGSAKFEAPFTYDDREAQALYNKFGYDAVAYDASPFGATYERMEDELSEALEMFTVGLEPRQNINKTTGAPNLFDNFETLRTQELAEDTGLVDIRSEDATTAPPTTSTTPLDDGGPY